MPFWRNFQNSDARRDAQPHFLLVKNTFFPIFLPFWHFFVKKYAQNAILSKFMNKYTQNAILKKKKKTIQNQML